ncbi:MAG: hypothetical protein WBM54_15405 [Woeseia sp.]
MRFRSAEKTLTLAPVSTRCALMLLLLVAGLGLSQGVRAASDASVDCGRLETSLRSLEVATDDLDGNKEALDEGAALSTTPVLLLTPRASSISREVFAALPIDRLDESSSALDDTDSTSDSIQPEPSSPPIVKYPLLREAPASTQPADSASDVLSLPRFQKQMYRTDI